MVTHQERERIYVVDAGKVIAEYHPDDEDKAVKFCEKHPNASIVLATSQKQAIEIAATGTDGNGIVWERD